MPLPPDAYCLFFFGGYSLARDQIIPLPFVFAAQFLKLVLAEVETHKKTEGKLILFYKSLGYDDLLD